MTTRNSSITAFLDIAKEKRELRKRLVQLTIESPQLVVDFFEEQLFDEDSETVELDPETFQELLNLYKLATSKLERDK